MRGGADEREAGAEGEKGGRAHDERDDAAGRAGVTPTKAGRGEMSRRRAKFCPGRRGRNLGWRFGRGAFEDGAWFSPRCLRRWETRT